MISPEGIVRLVEVAQAARYQASPHSGLDPLEDDLRLELSYQLDILLRLLYRGYPWYAGNTQAAAYRVELALQEWEGDHESTGVRRRGL